MDKLNELNKLKSTQLPYIIKDADDNYIGQISVVLSNNLTSASFMLNFQSETKVINNKETIKQAYIDMQDFFKQELISCGWDFLFEEEEIV